MSVEWVVEFEMTRDQEPELDGDLYDQLIHHLSDATPGLLYTAGRYALLLCVRARGPLEAHSVALGRWEEAIRTIGAPVWPVVRAEVLTGQEFERQYRLADSDDAPMLQPAGNVPSTRSEALLQEVFQDPPTGLPTAAALRARIQHVLKTRRHPTRRHALLVLDLDPKSNGPPVPGHDDLLLVNVLGRLAAVIRPSDVVARVARRALGVLVPDLPDDQVPAALARRLLGAVDAEPSASVRLGVAVSRPGYDADRLYSAALAAAEAARRGGERWVLFTAGVRRADPPGSAVSTDAGTEGCRADE